MTEPAAVPELVAEAARQLAAAGVGSPRVDAELLLAHVLGVPRSRLPVVAAASRAEADRYAGLVARRASREPLQHIVGVAPFRHLDVAVGPGVFVPRPETELLVDAVLEALRGQPDPVVVDLCAGSGAIALAVAQERPDSTVIAVEVDDDALVWLLRNTAGTRVRIEATDVRDRAHVGVDVQGTVDAVVSNPPYVPDGVGVDPEVLADPQRAVFGGPDGLALVPAVIDAAAVLLRPPSRTSSGFFAMEHDESHGIAVVGMLERDPRWTDVRLHDDLAGRPRFTTALRTPTPA